MFRKYSHYSFNLIIACNNIERIRNKSDGNQCVYNISYERIKLNENSDGVSV